MNEPSASADSFGLIADQFVAAWRQGQRPSVEEYAQRYPEHAEALRELLPALVLMAKAKSAEDTPQGRQGPRPGVLRELGDYRPRFPELDPTLLLPGLPPPHRRVPVGAARTATIRSSSRMLALTKSSARAAAAPSRCATLARPPRPLACVLRASSSCGSASGSVPSAPIRRPATPS
ncbi:MAG: hypothetical protein L0Z62_05710 [Gemmataceae bacterium]|nr:hypothetical protein [Gemmataceae bacterium]